MCLDDGSAFRTPNFSCPCSLCMSTWFLHQYSRYRPAALSVSLRPPSMFGTQPLSKENPPCRHSNSVESQEAWSDSVGFPRVEDGRIKVFDDRENWGIVTSNAYCIVVGASSENVTAAEATVIESAWLPEESLNVATTTQSCRGKRRRYSQVGHSLLCIRSIVKLP